MLFLDVIVLCYCVLDIKIKVHIAWGTIFVKII